MLVLFSKKIIIDQYGKLRGAKRRSMWKAYSYALRLYGWALSLLFLLYSDGETVTRVFEQIAEWGILRTTFGLPFPTQTVLRFPLSWPWAQLPLFVHQEICRENIIHDDNSVFLSDFYLTQCHHRRILFLSLIRSLWIQLPSDVIIYISLHMKCHTIMHQHLLMWIWGSPRDEIWWIAVH